MNVSVNVMIAQGTPEWFAQRRGRITASRAAACLGLNPYQSPREAWRQIMGRDPKQFPNEHMRRGIVWEPTTRRRYEGCIRQAGLLLPWETVQPGGFWVHPVHEWLAASPDGLIGDTGACELKNPESLFWKSGPKKGQPKGCPIMYRMQCWIQMACTGRLWVDFFSWPPCEKQHYWERIMRPSPEALASLVAKLGDWHREYVLGDKEPPDGRTRAGREAACEAAESAVKWGFEL